MLEYFEKISNERKPDENENVMKKQMLQKSIRKSQEE